MGKGTSRHKAPALAAVTLLALSWTAAGERVSARGEPVRYFDAPAEVNAQASARHVAAPDAPGPYNVGTTTFPATMTNGRVTLVQVFYPTLDQGDCGRKYTVQSPAGPYQVTSPYCAAENAAVASGPFPAIAHDAGRSGSRRS